MIVGMDGDDTGVFEQTLRFLQATRLDAVQLNILTPLPGTPLYADMAQADRVTDRDWSHYDYRHVVFRPARMTAAELQAGADWLYAQFYRLDRILGRFARAVFTVGWMPALLGLKLGLTYRYDNKREGIVGWNPARRCDHAAESGCYWNDASRGAVKGGYFGLAGSWLRFAQASSRCFSASSQGSLLGRLANCGATPPGY